MSVESVSRDIYDSLRTARISKNLPQEVMARTLGVAQPRIAEMEARLREGRPTKQLKLLLEAAAACGLVPVLVPEEALDAVRASVDAATEPPIESVYDQVYLDIDFVDEDEPSAPSMSP